MTSSASKRPIKRGEALAIMSEMIHSDHRAQWWDYYSGTPLNEKLGTVSVVCIRGSLDHHSGYCDSYESILDRVSSALSGDDVVEVAKRKSYWDESVVVPPAEPPTAVVLRIDSPGGVCSGLNETVFALRKMAAAAEIPLIAYVDELAASAAYALACACSEIILPASAIAGSIGVISGMYDQTAADEKMGIKFVTLKSGARKDDGHPHVALTDAALNAEQRRVDKLAKQFYRIVAQARPLSSKEIEALQAGIFLGSEVVAKGLADAVMGWDEVIDSLNDPIASKKSLAKLSHSDSNSDTGMTNNVTPSKETGMSLAALTALVKRATAAVASEQDPKKKKALTANLATYQASLEAYKKEKHSIEKTETEEGEDPTDGDDEKDDDGGDDSDEDEKKSEASEESAEMDEEKEKKSAKALLGAGATAEAVNALAAVYRKANAYDQTRKDVEMLKANAEVSAKNAMIDAALGMGGKPVRITPAEAIHLRGAKTSEVKFFLSMRKGAIINTENGGIHVPDPSAKPGDGSGLSAEILKQVDTAVFAAPEGIDRAKLRASMLAEHEKRMSAGLNGAGGRY